MPRLPKSSANSQLGRFDQSSTDDAAIASTAGSLASKAKHALDRSILHESVTSDRHLLDGSRTEMPPIRAAYASGTEMPAIKGRGTNAFK